MRVPKKYADNLRDCLKDAGRYRFDNEPLIENAARCQFMIDNMMRELQQTTMMLTQIGCTSQEKRTIHPYVPIIREFSAVLARCLIALGFGNNSEVVVESEDLLGNYLKKID